MTRVQDFISHTTENRTINYSRLWTTDGTYQQVLSYDSHSAWLLTNKCSAWVRSLSTHICHVLKRVVTSCKPCEFQVWWHWKLRFYLRNRGIRQALRFCEGFTLEDLDAAWSEDPLIWHSNVHPPYFQHVLCRCAWGSCDLGFGSTAG